MEPFNYSQKESSSWNAKTNQTSNSMIESQQIGVALEAMLAGIVERVSQQLLNQLQKVDQPAASLPVDHLGLEPMRAYTAREVADILGIKRLASVYEIPDHLLPRVRRIGSSIGFLGINVLCYMHDLPPVNVAGVVEAYRKRLLDEKPIVRPLPISKGGRTRVL